MAGRPVPFVAAMILHEEGKFRLEDPVSRFVPEFDKVVVFIEPGGATRVPARPVTVQDLLLHTSGLSHRTSDLYKTEKVRSRRDTLPQFIANIVRVPLMEDPGTRFRYSEATTVVGRLIEIWSGRSLDAFLDERLFRPLGMTDTTFWVPPTRGRGSPPCTPPRPEAGWRRSRSRMCRSPSVPRFWRARSVWCRPSPISCASARCS
jgi:CubicO group peptidase (beta-lactamase class C family)